MVMQISPKLETEKKIKVFVAVGHNHLLDWIGPCGVFRTREEAIDSARENCDTWRIFEYYV